MTTMVMNAHTAEAFLYGDDAIAPHVSVENTEEEKSGYRSVANGQ